MNRPPPRPGVETEELVAHVVAGRLGVGIEMPLDEQDAVEIQQRIAQGDFSLHGQDLAEELQSRLAVVEVDFLGSLGQRLQLGLLGREVQSTVHFLEMFQQRRGAAQHHVDRVAIGRLDRRLGPVGRLDHVVAPRLAHLAQQRGESCGRLVQRVEVQRDARRRNAHAGRLGLLAGHFELCLDPVGVVMAEIVARNGDGQVEPLDAGDVDVDLLGRLAAAHHGALV